MLSWLRHRRRDAIVETPFPDEWRVIMEEDVRAVRNLTPEYRARLQQLVQVFLVEKHFEGCAGLELTDRIRVVIATQACMLLLGRDHDLYRDVETILVYPSTVRLPNHPRSVFDLSVDVVQDDQVVLGVAHDRGPVVLAWDATKEGAYDPTDGRNVVYHEFAHKLDMLTGDVDGTPPLPSRADRRRWAEALEPVFLALRQATQDGDPTFLDGYGAVSEGEFFAVATEHFFEQPKELKARHPELYRELAAFYKVDLS
ncbi:MAG: zinc-dependent peptidase [Myxococcales bacterium]|nr:zinc-dependent peptidase [Myxococcales bacterium]